MEQFRIQNGTEVVCRITGIKGRVVSSASHLNGCDRYFVQPPVKEDGTVPDGYWIDDFDLKPTKAKVLTNGSAGKKVTGGLMSKQR